MREHPSNGDVYVLSTARNGKPDLLAGLAARVDNYVVKGAPVEQLAARMAAARRITQRQSAQSIKKRCGALADPLILHTTIDVARPNAAIAPCVGPRNASKTAA